MRNNLIDLQKFSKDYKYYSEVKNLGNSFFVWKILNLEIFMRSFEKNKLNSNL